MRFICCLFVFLSDWLASSINTLCLYFIPILDTRHCSANLFWFLLIFLFVVFFFSCFFFLFCCFFYFSFLMTIKSRVTSNAKRTLKSAYFNLSALSSRLKAISTFLTRSCPFKKRNFSLFCASFSNVALRAIFKFISYEHWREKKRSNENWNNDRCQLNSFGSFKFEVKPVSATKRIINFIVRLFFFSSTKIKTFFFAIIVIHVYIVIRMPIYPFA